MRKFIKIGAMVVIAVMVGVLAVFGAAKFEYGIRTTGIVIGTTSGEGEGEGEPANDTLTFENDDSKIDFQGPGHLDFASGGDITFDDAFSTLDFSHGGAIGFDAPAGEGGMLMGLAGGLPGVETTYMQLLLSTGVNFILGDAGVVIAGKFTQMPDEGEGEGEGQDFSGVYLCGAPEDSDAITSMVHAGPTGGLEGEGEGEAETGPVAEMATFVPGGQSFYTNQTASLTLKGNDTQGEIVLQNYLQDDDNTPNASITVSSTGSIIMQLGAVSEPGAPIGGEGNTEGMTAAPNTMAQESVQTDSAGGRTPIPRIGIHSLKTPFSGS